MKETVLIIGATGNVGVSAVIASLRSGRNVLAIVRNQASAEKMFKHVGTREGITTVEVDVISEDGVAGVVDKVRAGTLPGFQHVYSADAYRATIPYLLSQANPHSTYTLITGSSGDLGIIAVTGITQGALYALANAAILENAQTNIRFNEVCLKYRVDYDSVSEGRTAGQSIKASEFARVYEGVLERREVDGCRVVVEGKGDVEVLRFEGKIGHGLTNEAVAGIVL
ncbi:hypothetical protein PRZ48_004086 [Zasmidium cellare]|uniref:NmrA-like domain-containing protein n=1 Tax=Zasmidium cellare TaxID=395010 RepID=A0ABR0EYF4_ZASCE|nr:hypothetical protein PRZ48_004086 [Zasmidium cellare]